MATVNDKVYKHFKCFNQTFIYDI